MTILAFIQDQIVNHLRWLTPQQFLDGLALGQLTPGPIVMLAAFVGYEVGAIGGAVVAAAAVYLPSFILMLAVLPAMGRLKRLAWMNAALRGISPAVIGMTAVAFECRGHHTSDATPKMTSLRTPVTVRPRGGGRPWPLTRVLTRAVKIIGCVRPALWRHLRS